MMSLLRRMLGRPRLSVILVIYDMQREAPRTLQSLAPGYQQGVSADDYEVIVVDNGSPIPLGEVAVKKYGSNFSYHYIKNASPSPASAVNLGVDHSRGEILNIMIDGARIVSPGLLYYCLSAFKAYDDPTVAALGWHLGPDNQTKSILTGYNREIEDKLLASINWPKHGYDLFKISSLGGSSRDGCFSSMAESNTIGISRNAFEALKGYDTAFNLPGGGLVNPDFYKRAAERPDTELVCLLGEGSFHQLHGGAATGLNREQLEQKFAEWTENFRQIRGVSRQSPRKPTDYMGSVRKEVLPYIAWSAKHRIEILEDRKRAASKTS